MAAMQMPIMMLLIFGVFYLLIIRPQAKKQKEHQEMLQKLGKGAVIVTRGGIIGTITGVQGTDVVVVEIGDRPRHVGGPGPGRGLGLRGRRDRSPGLGRADRLLGSPRLGLRLLRSDLGGFCHEDSDRSRLHTHADSLRRKKSRAQQGICRGLGA